MPDCANGQRRDLGPPDGTIDLLTDHLGVAFRFGHGEPAHAIAEYARSGNVDLIVMSTHGIGASGRYALGSVAMKVLMTAPCPVFMVRINEAAERSG